MNSEKVESYLHINNITLDDDGSILTCKAENLVSEIYTSLKLKILLNTAEKDFHFNKSVSVHDEKNATYDIKYNYFSLVKSTCSPLKGNYNIVNLTVLVLYYVL